MAGFFRNPFVIEYRRIGVLAKEWAVALDIAPDELHFVSLLNVETHEFVSERHMLKIGLLRSAFEYFENKTNHEDLGLAHSIFIRNVTDYFSTRPGVSADEGCNLMHSAFKRYFLQAPQVLLDQFVSSIHSKPKDGSDPRNIPGLSKLMDTYTGQCIQHVMAGARKLGAL